MRKVLPMSRIREMEPYMDAKEIGRASCRERV